MGSSLAVRWMNRQRLTVYPAALGLCLLLLWGFWALSGEGVRDRAGQPIGTDFVTFYAASELALDGAPASMFDAERLKAAENRVAGAELPVTEWHYPPAFLLAVLPLSLLPYLPALAIWLSATAAALVAVVRRISTDYLALLLVFAFPGFYRNLTQGQNGFLTAALLGGGLTLLQGRPFAGGVVLGLLTYKPHLALLVFVALAAGREVRALAGAAASSLAIAAAGLLAFGPGIYEAFFRDISHTTDLLYGGQLKLEKMHTIGSMVLLAGAGSAAAQAAQLLASAAAAAVVAWAWWRRLEERVRFAVLTAGVVAAAPFLFDYDLVILVLPMLWFGLIGMEKGWLSYEREGLLLLWLSPFIAAAVVGVTGIMVTPLLLAGFLGLILRRGLAEQSPRAIPV